MAAAPGSHGYPKDPHSQEKDDSAHRTFLGLDGELVVAM